MPTTGRKAEKHPAHATAPQLPDHRDFLDRYQAYQVGGRTIIEYWIPAQDLAELNANIVGRIEVVAEYHQD